MERKYSKFQQFSERVSGPIIYRVTADVVLTNTAMFKSKKNVLEHHSKIKQKTKFHNGFVNRKCHFKIVILGLIDAELDVTTFAPEFHHILDSNEKRDCKI